MKSQKAPKNPPKGPSRVKKVQTEPVVTKRAEALKLIVAVALVLLGVYASSITPIGYLQPLLILLGVVSGVLVALFWTKLGRRFSLYFRDSLVELRKVVWPQRQEAFRVLLFVAMFVTALAVFIWMIDSIVFWLFFDILLKGKGS